MRTDRAKLVILCAERILAMRAEGRNIDLLTISWAEKIIAANGELPDEESSLRELFAKKVARLHGLASAELLATSQARARRSAPIVTRAELEVDRRERCREALEFADSLWPSNWPRGVRLEDGEELPA